MAKKTQGTATQEPEAQEVAQEVTEEVTAAEATPTQAPQVEIPSDLALETLADFVKPTVLAIVKAKKTGKLQIVLSFKEGIIGDEISTFFFPTQTV